jgi:ElaB/YqjD/DUF883 family membrane-anchored ribosome-binding protein
MKTSASGVEESAQAIAEAAGKGAEVLKQDFQKFIADVEQLMSSVKSVTGENLAQFKDQLAGRLEAAKKAAGAGASTVAASARKAAAVTDDYVKEEPWKAVGIGVVVGFLLGLLTARRGD